MYTFCFVAVVYGQVTNGQVTTAPENVAGLVGSNVTLRCAGTNLAWEDHRILGTMTPISRGTNRIFFPNMYDLITVPTGTYNLIMKSVQLNQGGLYKCRALPGSQYGMAEVVIFSGETFFFFSSLVLLLLGCFYSKM